MVSQQPAPEVRVLSGTVSVKRPDGETVQPAGNTARLLALLVSRAGRPVSVNEIARAVWPDVDPEVVAREQQVERLVSGLREMLGEGAREIIPFRKHDRYRFDARAGHVWVDSVHFDRLAGDALSSLESGDVGAARRHASEALALWKSDPVVLPDEWMSIKRRRRSVLLVAAQAAMRSGEHAQAAAELASFVEDHPDDEAVWQLLVEARLAGGERVLAAQACAEAARRFEKFGGMGPKLSELCRPLFAGADTTIAPDPGPAPEETAAERGPAPEETAPDPGPAPEETAAERGPAPEGTAPEPGRAPQAAGATATPQPPSAVAEPPRRRSRRAVAAGTALAVAVVAGLAVLVASAGDDGPQLVTVYNQEGECQRPRSENCRLGLARDPYTRYTAENVVGFVWHGDMLRADCFVGNGARVQAEDGTPSTHWYRVALPGEGPRGPKAWLTGVRVRPGTEPDTPRCEAG